MDSDDAVDKEKVLKEHDSTKVKIKQEGDEKSIRERPGKRLKMKARKKSKRQKTDYDFKEEEHLKTFLQIESKFYHLDRHGVECIYYKIFRSNESSRWTKTFSEMVTRFDRIDLEELYNLVMQRFETMSLEGVDLVLWGDLRTMFTETTDDDLWKNQEEWILKSWNFYENCGVHTFTLKDGIEVYMLAKRRYPLIKETLERMLTLRWIAQFEYEAIFDLLRFIQKKIDESGSHDGSWRI
nr:hypothetical protein [Tanacetum cinerariifolium]